MNYSSSILKDERWVITKWLEFMQGRGINVVQEGFDMVPHAQCFNGGVRIDAHCRTEVAGLYAAGEVAGGPHGADRLGGAAIAATQVFGAIAGEQAALWAAGHTHGVIERGEAGSLLNKKLYTQRGGKVDIIAYETELRSLMWTCGAIVRSAKRCETALHRIQEMQREFNPGAYFPGDPHMREAAQLHTSLSVAEVLLSIMNERRESRGPHYRLDYPEQDIAMAGMLETRLSPDGFNFKLIPQQS
jgi:succinate dehydrogenase/fumarate reductase flavoprotein subunit